MTTLRVTAIFDYDVPEGTDPDEFHDELRDRFEDGSSGWPSDSDYSLESVRDIDVEELGD